MRASLERLMGAKQLIRHEDFLSATIHIKLRNLVSDTLVDSKIKTVGNIPMGRPSETNLVQLLEILAGGLILSVPILTCAVGHTLEIELSVTHLSKYPFHVQLLVRVKDVEKTSEDQERVTVDLKNGSDVAWKDFCELFSRRQEAIHEFLKGVRGY